jgi:hypothetical protein
MSAEVVDDVTNTTTWLLDNFLFVVGQWQMK